MKSKVPLWGKPQGFAVVDTDATKGATLGVNVYRADGSIVTEADLNPAAAESPVVGRTLWSLVLEIPALVTALAALATDGFVRKSGSTLSASAITNADLPDMATKTVKARKTASTGDPEDCTVSEVLDFVPGTPAKGDLIVRDTSAMARIAAGTATHVLTSNGAGALPTWQAAAGGGGGISSGTSNPGSPSDNQLFYRTDIDMLIFYHAAISAWLTVQEIPLASGGSQDHLGAAAGTTLVQLRAPVRSDYQMFLTRWSITTFVASNTLTQYWTCSLKYLNAANAATTIVSFNTSADTSNNWVQHDQVINALLNAAAKEVHTEATKTASPGVIYTPGIIWHRLVIP